MRFLFILFFFLNLNADNEFFDIISRLDALNTQIKIIKYQVDNNISSLSQNDFRKLQERKNKLLKQIPIIISDLKNSQNQIKTIVAQKIKELNKNKNLKSLKEEIDFINLNLDINFYQDIIALQNYIEENKKISEINNMLENQLIEFQTSSFSSIKALKQKDIKNIFENEILNLESKKFEYEEILSYLKQSSNSLNSGFFINDFGLKNTIDYINASYPLKGVNIGKILILIVIILSFFLLMKVFLKLSRLIPIFKDSQSLANKFLKKPIICIISVYALKICFHIVFYPAPLPIILLNIFAIAAIISFTWVAIGVLKGYGAIFMSEIAKKSQRKEIINLLVKIIYFVIITICILMILSQLGFDISAIIASLGIGGLAVAFAAKDVLANFFSSVMLLLDNSFSQGENISCGDIEGVVVEIGLRTTTIRSLDNSLIFVPNSKFTNEAVRNWSRRKAGRMIQMSIGLTYDSTRDKLLKCIKDIDSMIKDHPMISREDNGGVHNSKSRQVHIISQDDLMGYKNLHFVNLDQLNDSSIDIKILCFSKTITLKEFSQVKQDIIFKIIKIVEDNGLSFAFPSQSIYIEKD